MMHGDHWQFLIPLLALALGFLLGYGRHLRHRHLVNTVPAVFRLNARPLFTTEERLMFRELKAALPQHVVLAKLNVLRFCQSASDREARWWFERLQAVNVTFAICTPNGSVISVIDLETPLRGKTDRHQRLKEMVLDSCRIRYLRCTAGQWPKPALLASWALGQSIAQDALEGRTDRGNVNLVAARAELAEKLKQRRVERAERTSRFHDSSFAPDSFFATDSRFDEAAANSSPAPLEAGRLPGRTSAGPCPR